MSFKNLKGQTARWIQRLQEYNFSSSSVIGEDNNANALSRQRCQEQCTTAIKSRSVQKSRRLRGCWVVAPAGWDPPALRTEQLNDPGTGIILEEVESVRSLDWKVIAERSPAYKSCWLQWESLPGAQLGIRRRTIKTCPHNYPLERSERRADRTICWTIGRSFSCQQYPGYFFWNPILFAICTSTFSKFCKRRIQWHVEERSVAILCN
jgi:hypothetical protein